MQVEGDGFAELVVETVKRVQQSEQRGLAELTAVPGKEETVRGRGVLARSVGGCSV
jgi:hypothetical protein